MLLMRVILAGGGPLGREAQLFGGSCGPPLKTAGGDPLGRIMRSGGDRKRQKRRAGRDAMARGSCGCR